MLDGTGAPCTKADTDTAGFEGKDGDAGPRQIRIAAILAFFRSSAA